jgi:hypothetical protein
MSDSHHFTSPPPLTAARDRGPSKYFHGRKEILSDFKDLLDRSTLAKSGTTFLIQGAPGAGKTALLAECESLAQKGGWETAEISSGALWDPNELQQSLKLRRTWKVGGGSARVGISGIGGAEISAERSPQTVMNLLRGGERPLLLTLDEAQILGKEELIPSDRLHTVVNILNSIHNGGLDRPVILLAAGLGTTVDAFESLGISRFAGGCLVELGALNKEAERAVLNDWLTKDGGGKGDPSAWIDAITQETHGWPQHIIAYVKPALRQLVEDGGVMTTAGLANALREGRELRWQYYARRTKGITRRQRESIARFLSAIAVGRGFEREDLVAALEKDLGATVDPEALFKKALRKGVLEERNGEYRVPIPSMRDWLQDEYARESIEIPREGQLGHTRPPRGEQLGNRGIKR